MKHFFLITNENRDPGLAFTNRVQEYIEQKGGTAFSVVTKKANLRMGAGHDSAFFSDNRQAIDLRREQIECIMVFGGDGTFVRASRDMAEYGIPVIGVNLGTLGYLCELEKNTVFSAIDRIFSDEYVIETRMMLKGMTVETEPKRARALNDIVIHRKDPSQMIRLKITVNGEYLNTYNADGFIIAAPTGSTSYNLSAGGPIVDPKADMIVLTPINPHELQSRSIVIGSDSSIEVELQPRRPERDETATVDLDGDNLTVLKVGDRISICRSEQYVRILRLNRVSFLQILRKKMGGS